jgi:hypothetical protein
MPSTHPAWDRQRLAIEGLRMAGLINLRLLTDFFNKIGPLRQIEVTQQFSRFRSEAEIQRAAKRARDAG